MDVTQLTRRSWYSLHFIAPFCLFCLLTLTHGCTPSLPLIKSVIPDNLVTGKPADITINATGASSDADIILTPGGPFTRHTLPMGYLEQVTSTADLVLAIDATGSVHFLHIDDTGLHLVSSLTLDGAITHIAVDADRLFLTESGYGIKQFDIHNHKKPVLLHQLPVAQTIQQLAVDTDNVFFITRASANEKHLTLNRILRADLQDRKNSKTTTPNSIIEITGPVNDLRVAEHQCYLAGPAFGLAIYDCASHTLRQLGQFATTGSAQHIALKQPLAYLADGDAGVVVLDVSDPAHIQWRGSHNKLGGYCAAIVIHGDTAVVRNVIESEAGRMNRLVSLNISKPQLPITGSFYKMRDRLQDIAMLNSPQRENQQSADQNKGNASTTVNVIAATDHGLAVIDFSTPANIQISNEGINLGGSRRAFIKDNIAYVADWFSGLHMYDISTPARPRHIGNFHTPGSSKGVVVKDHYAFVGDDDHGLQIIDVSDPSHPQHVSEMSLTGLSYTLKQVDNLLYLADHRGGFHIIDVSDVKHPRHLSNVDTPGKSWAIDVTHSTTGDVAYVADDSDGLLIFDVSNKHHPVLLAQFDPGSHERGKEKGYAEDVLVKDNLAYVSFFDMGLYIVDVSVPSKPHVVSHLAIPGNARSIKLEGNYAYIAGWESGLQIVDVHDPRHPFITGYYDTNGSAWGADIDQGHAYVWDWWGGVKVIDIRDPQHPVLAGQYQGRDDIEMLRRQDNYLYCANGLSGVQVFDINNPLNPIWVTGVDTESAVHDISLDNTHAYAATDSGLAVLDISNHFQAHTIGRLATQLPLLRVSAAGDTVFAIDQQGTLLQLHRAPATTANDAPTLHVQHRYPLHATALWLSGHWLYLTTDNQGLLAFDTQATDGQLRLQAQYPAALAKLVTGNPAQQSSKNIGSKNIAPVSAPIIATWEPGVGVHLITLTQDGKSFTRLALIDIVEPVTDLALNDAGLDVYSPDVGLLHYVLDPGVKPRLMARYPATGRQQRFLIHDNNAFFAGEPTIASVSLIPDFDLSPSHTTQDSLSLTLHLPAHLPLGRYGLGIKNPLGPISWYYNALDVHLAPRKSPKFTLEDFKKILQQQP